MCGNIEGVDTASSVTMAGSHATIGRLGMPQCASNRVEKRASFVRGKESEFARGHSAASRHGIETV